MDKIIQMANLTRFLVLVISYSFIYYTAVNVLKAIKLFFQDKTHI